MNKTTSNNETFTVSLNPWWLLRHAGLGLLALLLGAYFFYDATLGYPLQKLQYETYQELQQNPDQAEAWIEAFEAQGWDTQREPIKRTDLDIQLQYIFGVSCVLSLLFSLWWIFRFARWRFVVGEEGVVINGKKRVGFVQIKQLNTEAWVKSGRVSLSFELNGKTVTRTYKDHCYDGLVEAMRKIKNYLEEKSEPEAVSNSPESDGHADHA